MITEKAWTIACEVHKNQKRFNGEPYIRHIQEVIAILDEMDFLNEKSSQYAILHDTFEDCNDKRILLNKLSEIDESIDGSLPSTIIMLTHNQHESYEKYIERIVNSKNKNIIAVKLADMIHNLTDSPTPNQREKYRKNLPKLIKALLGCYVIT